MLPRFRIRFVVPHPPELAWLGISCGLHTVVFAAFLLNLSGQSPAAGRGSALVVRLIPGPAAGGGPPALARPAPPQPPRVDPKAPPTRRFVSQAEKNAVLKPRGLTAQPADLPQAKARPASLPEVKGTADGNPAGEGTAALDLPAGPISGGVAGDLGAEGSASWYRDLVTARLQEAWRDRPLLPTGWPQARVVVGYRIQRDGKISDVRILVPSGYAPLDQSAYRVLAGLGTLPRPPAPLGGEGLPARFVFELTPPGVD